jgi:hypothetical protein
MTTQRTFVNPSTHQISQLVNPDAIVATTRARLRTESESAFHNSHRSRLVSSGENRGSIPSSYTLRNRRRRRSNVTKLKITILGISFPHSFDASQANAVVLQGSIVYVI